MIWDNFILLEYLIENYKHAKTNLDKLVNFGAQPLHKVDAVRMRNHTYLRMRKFDRIVFNFPDSGFPDRESDHCTIVEDSTLVSFILKQDKTSKKTYYIY